MATLNKVRVQLLDVETGAVIEEVDVLTSADSVKFADGQTFQQKLDAGVLTGAKGDTGVTGTKGDQGIQGIQGVKGDTGAKGDQGIQGIKGNDGTDGSKMYNVTATPINTLGAVGDWALNTTNGDVYQKTAATVWTKQGNFKGTIGATGAKGDKGDPGDTVKVGTDLATAVQRKLFFKVQ